MRSFIKQTLASCFGTLLAFFSIVTFAIVVIAIYSNKEKANQQGILHIPLDGLVLDYSINSFNVENFNFSKSSISMWEIRNKLIAAANDKSISGIFLDIQNPDISQDLVIEIMNYLEVFKMSGKKIIAYSYYYNQNSYLLSTISDSIYLNPNGGVDLKGYGMYAPFFNNILEKFGVDINVYYAGKYKGSTEPYRLDHFSQENKFQLRAYLSQLHEILTTKISKNRNIDSSNVEQIISDHISYDADYMLKNRIVDRLLFYDEFEEELQKIFNKSDLVPFKSYTNRENKKEKNKIALVFAEGEIVWGNSESGTIGQEKYAKIFQDIRKDEDIKSVVIRFDSPGGNGYASDLLHREISLMKKAGKKVYASFGSMAASGAYYMAVACDTIIASDNSLTGSIGVYIMLPTFNKLLNEKLEIEVDSVSSSRNALGYNALFAISEKEQQNLKSETEKLYDLFLDRVSKGRSIGKDSIHTIAQGRIWSGKDAKDVGLVDELGSLEDALNLIAKNSHLEKYSIETYPKQSKNFTSELISESISQLSISHSYPLELLNSKSVEIQKLMENPTPRMDIPLHSIVTKQ